MRRRHCPPKPPDGDSPREKAASSHDSSDQRRPDWRKKTEGRHAKAGRCTQRWRDAVAELVTLQEE
jgi:hypothetical protein